MRPATSATTPAPRSARTTPPPALASTARSNGCSWTPRSPTTTTSSLPRSDSGSPWRSSRPPVAARDAPGVSRARPSSPEDVAPSVAAACVDLAYLLASLEPAPVGVAQLSPAGPARPAQRVRVPDHTCDEVVRSLLERRAITPRLAGQREATTIAPLLNRQRGNPTLIHVAVVPRRRSAESGSAPAGNRRRAR